MEHFHILHALHFVLIISFNIPAIIQSPIPMANQEIVPARIQDASSAASTSASTSYSCYDIFINHRGPDVKDTFAINLYRRLLDLGLQVFLDREELVEGHPISSQIEAAIRVASVQVAIFSPTYAESYWCMNELVLMINSKATILPVFYKVDPSVLRWTSGAYADALQNLQQKTTRDPQTGEAKPRYDSDTIESWRNALSHVAGISGFVLHGEEGEGELLEKLVHCVLKKVPKTPLDVAKYPTGLGEKLQDFERTVLSEQQGLKTGEAKVAGIVGVGGVGKTTLAKQFFNLNRSHYNTSCFLSEVRENAGSMSLSYLQSKLIQELKHTDIKIESRDQGIEILKKHLSSCHALIILDDMDSRDQMEAFLPIKDILSPQSFILVTSRDKHVLRSSGVLDSSIYNLKGLHRPDSKELFCSYAFYQRHPLPGFEDLVDRFVMACDGLPLSLKVFGALVCRQKQSYWEDILDRLHERLPNEIQERLRISYESLDKEDQSIFLDIVCFFIGKKIDMAIRIWGMAGIQNLENKCLLAVDSKNKIKMHDHIRVMGRGIAKEGSIPRRLSHIDQFLEQPSSGITEVRGISMVAREEYFGESVCRSEMPWYNRWRHEVLGNRKWKLFNNNRYHCTNLKILATEDAYLIAILRRVRSPHLIWLRWYKCPYSSLPSWVPLKNLRVLEVFGSRLKTLWQSETQAPLDLRELTICAPLSQFPKSIRELKHLEKIVLNSGDFKTLPEESCNLSSLKYLVLERCSRMTSLSEYFGKLTNLQHIVLSHAYSLRTLPNSFGNLTNLQRIDLSDTFALQMLPNSFGNLTNLREIRFFSPFTLHMLPNSFGNLTNLQHIDLSYAYSLRMLPNSFGNLTQLKHLNLSCCNNLSMSRGTLGNITTLEYLNLSHCKSIKELPPQVTHQPSLEKLYLTRMDLKELPGAVGDLSNLEVLCLGSDLLQVLPPSFVYLKSLKMLELSGCRKLKCLPDSFGLLTQLTDLRFSSCGIEFLPEDLLNLKNLQILEVRNCPLRELPFKKVERETETELLKRGGALNKLDSKDKCLLGLKRLVLDKVKISEIAFSEDVCPNLQYLYLRACE